MEKYPVNYQSKVFYNLITRGKTLFLEKIMTFLQLKVILILRKGKVRDYEGLSVNINRITRRRKRFSQINQYIFVNQEPLLGQVHSYNQRKYKTT